MSSCYSTATKQNELQMFLLGHIAGVTQQTMFLNHRVHNKHTSTLYNADSNLLTQQK